MGIGGIGKATVTKAVYVRDNADFEAASFVSNVCSHITAADITGLAKLLFRYDRTTHSLGIDISLFGSRLGEKRVLLILDDVSAVEHLNALVGDWLASCNSRVIITSRDKHILNVAQVSSECIHEMSGLEINEGLQLFSWHSFLNASPNSRYEDLSSRKVETCKGHPLSLEVIESSIYDKQNDPCCWIREFHSIIFKRDIHRNFYINYCTFSDEGNDKMVYTVVYNLLKLLIKIDDKSVFDMHDHLIWGEVLLKEKKRSIRLWEAACLSTICNNINSLAFDSMEAIHKRLEMLYRLGLRYLLLRNLTIQDATKDTLSMLSTSLILLGLENYLPDSIGNLSQL